MNWTHRRPFRHQLNYDGGMNKPPINRPVTFREHFHVPKSIFDQPIDAIRLQLADYDDSYRPCPVHHPNRNHPYIRTFSDRQSSLRRTHSSVHSISTIATDFVHQRVSTIHTYPTSPSIIERQQIIDEDNQNIQDNQNEINQPTNLDVVQEQQQQQSNQPDQINIKYDKEKQLVCCRTCPMLIEIVDQQAQQIRQYTEQIAQQADLLAKLARRIAGIEEEIDDQKSDNTSEQQVINGPITT